MKWVKLPQRFVKNGATREVYQMPKGFQAITNCPFVQLPEERALYSLFDEYLEESPSMIGTGFPHRPEAPHEFFIVFAVTA